MKKYVKADSLNSDFINYTVVITLHIDTSMDLAASSRISEPSNPTGDHVSLSPEQLVEYNDSVDTILNAIANQGFKLLPSSHQSHESYSYYAISKLEDFPQYGEYTLIFRIAQHEDKHHVFDSPMVRKAIIRTVEVDVGNMRSEYDAQQKVKMYGDEFKELIREIAFQNVDVPEVLYHATFEAYLPSIKELGLIPNSPNSNWDGLSHSVVYLSDDLDTAESFCEAAEDVSDEVYDSGIAIFEVLTDNLDESKLHLDRNILDDLSSFEYSGVIPYKHLKRIQ